MSEQAAEVEAMDTPLTAAGVDVHGFPIDCCDEHPECSHVYYAVQVYDACKARLEAAERDAEGLREALREIERTEIEPDTLKIALAALAARTEERPRLLDLFCGAGGAAMGYHRAGFEVVGVDIKPQPRYPFAFRQADALEFLREERWYLAKFDAIHASPPCQAYTQAALSQRNAGKVYADLLAPTRELLEQTRLPWVIENVPGAPMRPDIKLCGCQVGLELRRERWFETNWLVNPMVPPHHHPHAVPSVVGHGTPSWVREQLGYNPTIADYRASMGIDWMNRNELSEAIPPAYTEFIGAQLLTRIRAGVAA